MSRSEFREAIAKADGLAMTDTTKLLRQYESLLEAAEDDEQIFRAKLADATRRRAHWKRRIADLKAEPLENWSASLVAAE